MKLFDKSVSFSLLRQKGFSLNNAALKIVQTYTN